MNHTKQILFAMIEDLRRINQLEIFYRQYRTEFMDCMMGQHSCSIDEARNIYKDSILTIRKNLRNSGHSQFHSCVKSYLLAIGKEKLIKSRQAVNN